MVKKTISKDDTIRFYISENLISDIDALYEYFVGEPLKRIIKHKIFFVCSTIHLNRVRRNLKAHEPVPIPASYFDDVLGRDNYIISKVLTKMPIENRGGSEIKGKTHSACLITRTSYGSTAMDDSLQEGVPYGYKLALRYTRNIRALDIRYLTLARRVRQLKAYDLDEILTKSPNYKYLYDCQKLVSFSSTATHVLDKYEIKKGAAARQSMELLVNILEENREDDYEFSVGPKSKRVFYIPNRLKRELRPHILLSKEPTVEIDIPASQPLFLSKIYPVETTGEKERYLSVVKSGKFYETLQELTPIYKYYGRRTIKEKTFKQIFFSRNKKRRVGPLMKSFKNEFPILAHEIWRRKERNHKELAWLTQNLESSFIIGTVVNFLREKRIPCLCIHDSVIVPQSQADAVKSWFFSALDDYLM